MNNSVLRTLATIVLFVITFSSSIQAKPELNIIELSNNEELTFEVYGKNNKLRILWIASSYGLHDRHKQSAQRLGDNDMEVWQVDLLENLFLPKGAEAIRSIPRKLVAELIEKISEQGKYEVLLLTSGYGTIPSLRGIHAWQSMENRQARLVGLISFSPYLYTYVPTLGMAPTLVPVSYVTNTPVYIFQAEKNGNRAHFPDMHNALQQHAPVYTKLTKGVTSLFYDEDLAPETLSILKNLPEKVRQAISALRRHEVPDKPIALQSETKEKQHSGLNVGLALYRGKVTPEPFNLNDANGKKFSVGEFKGKVTLINFWASWCPPCVEEIPSLNRLKQKMQGKPFELISINYAESADQIQAFMKKVKVDFPVLLDEDGSISTKWKVVAYPSTFVIGPDGKIQYGVNAAIHWDTNNVIQQLETLMK